MGYSEDLQQYIIILFIITMANFTMCIHWQIVCNMLPNAHQPTFWTMKKVNFWMTFHCLLVH